MKKGSFLFLALTHSAMCLCTNESDRSINDLRFFTSEFMIRNTGIFL